MTTDKSAALTRSPWQRVRDWLYGYDFFISYRWSDGSEYASALAQALRAKQFDCCLDSDEYAAGQNWTLLGDAALRATSRLVVIATDDALEDPDGREKYQDPIYRELAIFRRTQREVIRIQSSSLAPEKLEASPLRRFFHDENLHIDESPIALEAGAPSEETVERLAQAVGLNRRDRRRLRALQATVAVLSTLLLGTLLGGAGTWLAQRESARLGEEARSVSDLLTEVLESPNPRVRGQEVRVVDVLDAAAERIGHNDTVSPLVAARVRDTLGWSYVQLNQPTRGRKLIEQAWSTRSEFLGEDHEDTVQSFYRLAMAQWYESDRGDHSQRSLEDISKLLTQVLAAQVRVHGPYSPITSLTRVDLGWLYSEAKQLDRAAPLFKDAMKAIDVAGDQHTTDLQAKILTNYSNLLGQQAATATSQEATDALLDEREVVLLRALELRLGDDPNRETADVGESLNNLAIHYSERGKHEQAIAMSERAILIANKYFGEGHDETLKWRANLAHARYESGNTSGAIADYRVILSALEQTGNGGALARRIRRAYSVLLFISGPERDLAASASLLRQNIANLRSPQGGDLPAYEDELLEDQRRLMSVLCLAKQLDEARDLLPAYDRSEDLNEREFIEWICRDLFESQGAD
ncbi:MAG: toll/interleukin-1 receptor domain-containing protein [Pseudomonadota bacterium]